MADAAKERERLGAVRSLELLPHTQPSGALMAIVETAALVCSMPIALITIVEEHDQIFKAQFGLDVAGTPRDISFCSHAIGGDGIYEVCDAAESELFHDNPLVVGEPYIRFYAGAPMTTKSGHRIGTVCVVDRKPRRLTDQQREVLQRLATSCVSIFEEASSNRQRQIWTQRTLDSLGDCVLSVDCAGFVDYANPAALALLGKSIGELVSRPVEDTLELAWFGSVSTNPLRLCLETGEPQSVAHGHILLADGHGLVEIDDNVAPILNDRNETVGAVMVFRDVTMERELRRLLEWRGTHDSLTSAFNRFAFETELATHLERNCAGSDGAVLYLDLDQFKGVNDTLGHAVGDILLQEASAAMSSGIEGQATFARIGGDEFATLLTSGGIDRARAVAESLLASFCELRSSYVDERANVGASIGIVLLDEPGLAVAEVLRRADIGCYAAKNEGGNRHRVFDPTAGDLAEWAGGLRWMNIVQDAVRDDLLTLYGQKIVPVAVDRQPSVEVLLRLPLGESLVTPSRFMPSIERFRLGLQVDEWVVAHTLKLLAEYTDGTESFEAVHVNLSAQSIGDRATVDHLADLVSASGVPPEKLCFEITETGALTDVPSALYAIDVLGSLGVKFALDDFGRGFASFEYLKRLPFDVVKIDGLFVGDLATDGVSRQVISAIQGVCDLLGMDTVAECVESPDVLPHLLDLGVGAWQGFLHHRPEPLIGLLGGEVGV